MPPLISIALSTFNGERYLAEQLDSLLLQEQVEFEIVVVDDNSSDGTVDLLRQYAQRSSQLQWHPNPRNLGPTRSFERAFSLCRGEFLAPCDQDDIWHPRKIATLLSAMGDADLAYCDSEYIDASGARTGGSVSRDLNMMQGREPLAFLFANSISGHASLLRMELFRTAHPFPEGVYHDWWLALCAASGRGITYVDEPLIQFRRHADAFSPVGKKKSGRGNRAQTSKAWLEQFLRIMQAYGARDLPDHATAKTFAEALGSALEGKSSAPLLRAIWRNRSAAPRWQGIPALDSIKLQIQMLRKLKRARRSTSTY